MIDKLKRVIENERTVGGIEALLISVTDADMGEHGVPMRVSGVPVWAHARLHQGEYAVVRRFP
jgi:hypothetical protein